MDSFRLTLRVGTNKPLRLALRNRFKVKKRGVWFENNPVSDTRFELLITVARNIQFKVVSHVHSPNPNIINHLDFSVTRGRGLSFSTSGVLGQFPHESERLPATVDFIENTNQALLWFRHSMIKVTNHVMYDALKQRQIECWWVKNPMDLTGQSKQHYKVSGLLVSPTSAPK
uniref:Inter-alpha-trypsin inhibitor heavy chain C-terminal domain-containing protein n=1 Tax=Ciona savignyi TaxID=51511 RepID=H2ZHS2_CIOSA